MENKQQLIHEYEKSFCYGETYGGTRIKKDGQEIVEEAYGAGLEKGYTIGRDEAIEVIEGLMRFCRCFAQHHTDDIRYKEAQAFLDRGSGL